MTRFVTAVAVGIVAFSCGEGDVPAVTHSPSLQSTTIEYPEVVESSGGFRMTHPCSYLLHTFYTGSDDNKEEALDRLKRELDSLVPEHLLKVPEGVVYHGPDPLEVMHSPGNLTDMLMECHWVKERGEEDDQTMVEWRRKEAERMEDIHRQLREYDPLQHYYTPTPTSTP